jgi:hypothetical protein
MEDQVIIKKKRDLSGVLNASVAFIKQEYKTLWKILLLYTAVPVSLLVILHMMFIDTSLNDVLKILNDPSLAENTNSSLQGKTIMFTLMNLIVEVFIFGLSFCYIQLYTERGKGNFSVQEVWHSFTGLFTPLLGYSIVKGLIIMLAFIALILPGIYVMVPMSFLLVVKVVERGGLSTTFDRTFYLIKNHWWQSLALLTIASVVVLILSNIISIPLKGVDNTKGLLSKPFSSETIYFIIASFISVVGATMIKPVIAIVVAIQYYSLVQHKTKVSADDIYNS